MITQKQLHQIEKWLFANARPLEIAKWNLIFHKCAKSDLIDEMLKFQNVDGGFGNGFEPDIYAPDSSSVPSSEAIFLAQDYALDLEADWAKRLLDWYENTAKDTPAIWEGVPESLDEYPHAPWWGYTPNSPDSRFKPYPNAVVASALLSGTSSQRLLGEKIAERCVKFIFEDESFDWYDTRSLQRLFNALLKLESPLITPEVITSMNSRVLRSVCINPDEWSGFAAQPLDSIESPNSYWYNLLEKEVQINLDYWESILTTDGYWPLNFSWGMDTEAAQSATRSWLGYTAVKRIKTLKAFDRIEKVEKSTV